MSSTNLYAAFVAQKLTRQPPTGLAVIPDLHAGLFPFQKDLVAWALRRGRAAIFADTGLGKSRMQLEWARHVGGDVLILAPLAVARQTAREGKSIGLDVTVCREPEDVRPGVNVTNYDRIHKFDPSRFAGVVLDESSIIKHNDAKTFRTLIDAFGRTPFKLCATATPSPNDYTELGTHAEFLGVCTRAEMLAEYFCHDGGETQVWRLKGHARKAYWQWVASWAALLRKPSDLGYENAGYDLPALTTTQHVLPADAETVRASGLLFAAPAGDLTERRTARRASLAARVRECIQLITECVCSPKKKKCTCRASDRWVVWVDLNDEQDAIAEALGDECISIYGSLDADEKERRMLAFMGGEGRVLLSKPKIAGFGVNLQFCHRMAFVGVTDSYEAYYQAVRRIYRFGQTRECDVHIFASEVEGSVVANLERKARDAQKMAEELSAETRDVVRTEVLGTTRSTNKLRAGRRDGDPGVAQN